MLSRALRPEATKLMMRILNVSFSYSFYRQGNGNSRRSPQLLATRHKWQKRNLEKGCVSPRTPCSGHQCLRVLPSRVPFPELQNASLQHLSTPRDISITPKVLSVPLSQAHHAPPPLLCHTLLFESWRADPNPNLSYPA